MSHSNADEKFLAKMDGDTRFAFDIQGEYLGYLNENGRSNPLGIQVVAQKEGFTGKLMNGGLPGLGWYGGDYTDWSSSMEEGKVTLRSSDSTNVIQQRSNSAGNFVIRDQAGNEIGVLNKVKRTSPTLGMPAPSNALSLFDGKSITKLKGAKIKESGNLDIGFFTDFPVKDFRLHVEFRTPFEPEKAGQGRGNSGVYIQRRYEVQILDSFGLKGEKNHCAAIYRQKTPEINMCLPPGSWQTYDISFRAARFDDDGKRTEQAQISVSHNGFWFIKITC